MCPLSTYPKYHMVVITTYNYSHPGWATNQYIAITLVLHFFSTYPICPLAAAQARTAYIAAESGAQSPASFETQALALLLLSELKSV